jgi:hypothetical protein
VLEWSELENTWKKDGKKTEKIKEKEKKELEKRWKKDGKKVEKRRKRGGKVKRKRSGKEEEKYFFELINFRVVSKWIPC